MSGPHTRAAAKPANPLPRSRRNSQAAFLVGVPLAAAILLFIRFGPVPEEARRYVKHPVECVEVVMFCCALGALGAKTVANWNERRSCRLALLAPWDGKALPVAEAGRLQTELRKLPARLAGTVIVKRVAAVLDFLIGRGSADQLDDQLRALADNDALALESSYALTRFITWAIPILGFLGTVLGITGAISGVTPEQLEKNLNHVTDGLALAFDTTALALALTMVTMFLSFLVERMEQSVLDNVDRYVERELAHRFERIGTGDSHLFGVVERSNEKLVQTVQALVERQTKLWGEALHEAERRRLEVEQRQEQRLELSLQSALDKTLETHARRLAEWDADAADQTGRLAEQLVNLATTIQTAAREQQTALNEVAERVAGQVEALATLQEGDKHLRRLQDTLSQNLASIAGAGSFEEAIHSLTAAIHLLTARAAPGPVAPGRLGPRSGNAA